MAINVIEQEVKRKLKRIDPDNITHRVYECPVCGNGEVHVENSVFYGKCGSCDATVFDFEPLSYQMDFLMSDATYVLLIGGFGSGKTTIACFDDVYHALTVPNARILITAPTLQQMKAAILPELNKFTPPWFLVGGRPKGNPPIYRFTNGSEIYIYASDDEQKMRSLNLTRFHIEEGSGVDKSIFDQLQARLRNRAAVIYDEQGREIGSKFKGVISTNPEDSWIKDDFLLKSSKLHGSPSVDVDVYKPLMHNERVPLFESFISASFDNYKLPKGTIERISAGKSEKWKRKYLWSYLDAREGLVYDFTDHYVEPFDIPRSWVRIGGYDPGISDPTAALIGAINPETNVIYFYKEYYVRDRAVTEHGQALRPFIDGYSWRNPLAADPSVNKRSQETGVPYRTYFKQQTGITLMPVNNDILVGIDKVRDYLHNNKIKIFNNLLEFKREGSLYAFPTPEDTKNFKNTNNKPYDKDNHLMDALRYAIMPLPENPSAFTAISRQQDLYESNVYTANKLSGKGVTYGFRRGG